MSKLVGQYCKTLEEEPSKNMALSLKLSKAERDLFENFKTYVAQGVLEQSGGKFSPKIATSDLVHKLVFNTIKADKKFLKSREGSTK